MLEFYVEEGGSRIDRYLADQLSEISRSRIQKLIESGHVQVNGELCQSKKAEVEDGDFIQVELPEVQPLELKPEAIALETLYEDSSLIIINKAAGMVVHPSAGHDSGTLVNALLAHCESLPGINGIQRPGIVHRLDKDTTGAIVVAKTELAFHVLQAQFRTKTARRSYYAIVYGAPKQDSGTVDQPIGRHPIDRQKQDSQTLDINAIEVQSTALPASKDTPRSNSEVPNLKDAVKQTPQQRILQQLWQKQILLPAAIVIMGSVLVSYLYWKINQWLAAAIVFGLDLGLPIDISVNWGWDWFKGWIVAWVVAVIIAVVRVAKQMLLWPSLLSTLSIIGGALLIPTALVWGLRSGWPAMAATAWATLLGLSLSQAAWNLEKTVPTKNGQKVFFIYQKQKYQFDLQISGQFQAMNSLMNISNNDTIRTT
ncbi:MAG: RluA family pseudouridine synthase, partial [Leptolyngbya sp. Prado105]|nr:RluA family pseudouridine synthase [Leptolyngbya sp. Prado105]